MKNQTTGSRSSVAIVVGLAALVIGAIIAGTTLSLFVMREQEIELWKKQIDNLSLIMADPLERSVSTAEADEFVACCNAQRQEAQRV